MVTVIHRIMYKWLSDKKKKTHKNKTKTTKTTNKNHLYLKINGMIYLEVIIFGKQTDPHN